MDVGLELPFLFDRARLRRDLALIGPEEWTPHYNQNDYGGDWRGVALRSPDGRIGNLLAPLGEAARFADTPLMERCSYFRQAVQAFACPVKGVRLLSLAPGSFIREHTDQALVYEDGEMRVHIPVQTSGEVEFYVAGERLLLEEGRSYYVNVNLPHRIANHSGADRIHLILDLEVDEWVHRLVREARASGPAIGRTAARPGGFEEFAAAVVRSPALEQALQPIEEPGAFVETAARLAREHGFGVYPYEIEQALRHPFVQTCEAGRDLRGWTPVQVAFRERRPVIEWMYTGSSPFMEPFFGDTIKGRRRRPFAAAFRLETGLEETGGSLDPTGFVFHTSRCGSTLVAQMLGALPDTVVMSEPPPLDDILQAHLQVPGLERERQTAWVRAMVRALGWRRRGTEKRYFVKLDSWHALQLPLLRAAFPETPFVFLFRDPRDVLRSHRTRPGLQALPGAVADPRALGLTFEDIARLRPAEWFARVLGLICRAALANRNDGRTLFVDYRHLPEAVWGAMARHFALDLKAGDVERMRERTKVHAKDGSPWPEGATETGGGIWGEEETGYWAEELEPLYRDLRALASADG